MPARCAHRDGSRHGQHTEVDLPQPWRKGCSRPRASFFFSEADSAGQVPLAAAIRAKKVLTASLGMCPSGPILVAGAVLGLRC